MIDSNEYCAYSTRYQPIRESSESEDKMMFRKHEERKSNRFVVTIALALVLTVGTAVGAAEVEEGASAQNEKAGNKHLVFAAKVRAGGRFDNVRMCVATSEGTKGGPAADISLSTEVALSDTVSIDMDLPVFRPILFGLAFNMLQFEPSVTLKFRKYGKGTTDFIAGPTLGVSLHYGPDYKSGISGDARTDSFFALGPLVGGYVGIDFKRPCKTYNFQMGITPYMIPLFSVKDDQNHKGIVAGALMDFSFRFGKPNATP